jgi:acetolactate synthase-1/2/3 large subunit
MIKVSDYVAEVLVKHGVRDAFMVTGGGAMYLNHALGTRKEITCTFNHHEQACAIAAESYARLSNRLPVVNLTSGPGGTNAITGVYGAYVDSIPMLVISGQVKTETTVRSTGLPLRQLGDQELDIEELVRPITKYVQMVTDPLSIRYHLEKAIYLATSGRPGPVWLDIPLNIQAAKIEEEGLNEFDPVELDEPWKKIDLKAVSQEILSRIAKAKRPVIFAGGGVRLSGQYESFLRLIEKLGIPVVGGWNAYDLMTDDHHLYCGRPGTVGDRPGNFTVQNADLVLILGCRLNIRQVSYHWGSFAREAFKIWVDVDELELKKPTVKPDWPICADLRDLIPVLGDMAEASIAKPLVDHQEWLAWCKELQTRYSVVLPEYWKNEPINPYCFVEKLFEQLQENEIIVTGNGSACVTTFQAAKIKKGQRLWTNSGSATMGYDLPAAIGASMAEPGKRVICIAGDGSIMMNLQELQTIIGNRLPIKVFIMNNNGYVSIFQTHRNFFNGVEVGGGPKSGVTFPDFGKVVQAFGFPYVRATRHEEMEDAIRRTLSTEGPSVCELIIDEHVPFAPKLGSKQHPDGRITSPALEDLSPFLSREEFEANMIIPLLEEQ